MRPYLPVMDMTGHILSSFGWDGCHGPSWPIYRHSLECHFISPVRGYDVELTSIHFRMASRAWYVPGGLSDVERAHQRVYTPETTVAMRSWGLEYDPRRRVVRLVPWGSPYLGEFIVAGLAWS